MRIAVGHKGFEWVEITTEGIAAHGSRPDEGRDAIMRMGRILARLERLDKAFSNVLLIPFSARRPFTLR